MKKKWLFLVVSALTLANLGLFVSSSPASAYTMRSIYSCGCRMAGGGGQEPICQSWLYDECDGPEDTDDCGPCGGT